MSSRIEYRAIVRNESGREVPHRYIFPEPDVNWGSYFHNLRAYQVIRWESHEVNSDGSATAWSALKLGDRIRAEAAIADQPGQAARLEAIAREVDRVFRDGKELEEGDG